MKTLCILLVGLACVGPAQARTYQAIINDLRVEVKKGDAKAVALDKKIGHLDDWAKDRWEKEQAALRENAKLKKEVQVATLKGVGITTLVGVIVVFALSRRKKPAESEPTPEKIPAKAPPKKRAQPRRKVTR